MAIIGLLDWDLTRWQTPTVFNLELMKLAYYHKTRLRDVVQMERHFNSQMCSKVYIQKDYEDFIYPEFITNDPKVTWRGLALTDGLYVPMAPEIECCPADTSIYRTLEPLYAKTKVGKQIFKNLTQACHVRLSLDGQHVFEDWEKQLLGGYENVRQIIFHDKNFSPNTEMRSALAYIAAKYGRKNVRIGSKFPVPLFNSDELLIWGQYPKAQHINNVLLMKLMSDEAIYQVRDAQQQLTYFIQEPEWTSKTFIEALPKIFMQAIFLSKFGSQILLKIDKNFPIEEEWKEMVKLYNSYIRSAVNYRDKLNFCCFVYCKYCYYALTRENKIALFRYIQEHNPELFDLFYNMELVRYENKHFVPHMYTYGEFQRGGGPGGFVYRYRNQNKNRPEHFNYAEIIQPEYLYLE